MKKEEVHTKATRPASTVILVRELQQELQVYLLKRSRGSGFFPGIYVFPGGTLDPDEWDIERWQRAIDLSPEDLQKIFGEGLGVDEIIAYGVAAIRETFEEAGVFIAQRKEDRGKSFEQVCDLRSSGQLKEGWLRQRVHDEEWALSFSNLFPWSHWITPEAMPKRFDTRFFLALMPDGQECIPDARETVHGIWVSPEKGLQGNMKGEIPLSPPTLITLHELLEFGTLEQLKETLPSRSWGKPRLPVFMKLSKGAVIIEPWDPQCGEKIHVDPEGLRDKVIPPEEPFSRIWLHEGIWKPIRG